MRFRWLDDGAVQEVWKTAIEIHLSSSMLRAGLPEALLAMMPLGENAGDQLLKDLSYLNGIDALDDGSVPLHLWLETAALVSSSRREAEVFRRALARMKGPGDESHRPSSRRPIWSVRTSAELQLHPDREQLVGVMKMYASPKELRDVASQAGFDVSRVAFMQDLDGAAKDLLEKSFASGDLMPLIAAMRRDARVRRWHPDLQAMLDRDHDP